MARWKFSGRRVPKFKPGDKVTVKPDSSSPYRSLTGKVIIVTAEESGMVYSIQFDKTPPTLASYASVNEADLEPATG